jgi:hypothetical protein
MQPRSRTSSIAHPVDGLAPDTWYACQNYDTPLLTAGLAPGKRLGPPKLGDGHRERLRPFLGGAPKQKARPKARLQVAATHHRGRGENS